ncbi:MAG: hypothetical protein MHPSP_000241 [Paramarteilia canceri]
MSNKEKKKTTQRLKAKAKIKQNEISEKNIQIHKNYYNEMNPPSPPPSNFFLSFSIPAPCPDISSSEGELEAPGTSFISESIPIPEKLSDSFINQPESQNNLSQNNSVNEAVKVIKAEPQLKNLMARVTQMVPVTVLRAESGGQSDKIDQNSARKKSKSEKVPISIDEAYVQFMNEIDN